MPARMGSGPKPKPENLRRNRNPHKPQTVVALDAKVTAAPRPPLLLTPSQRRLWNAMWSQPIATLWNELDAAALCRLVILETDVDVFHNHALLAEMRHLEDRFLLNPTARAQQRVVIGDPSEGGDNDGVSWIDDARQRLHGTS